MATTLARDPASGVELVGLTRETYREALTLRPTLEQMPHVAPVAEALVDVQFCPELTHVGVRRHGRIVGFIVYETDAWAAPPTKARVRHLLVDRTEQRHGVGRAALDLLTLLLITRRGQRVMLEARVSADNAGALAFFRACDFALFAGAGDFLCRRLADLDDLQTPDRAPAGASRDTA